MVHGKELVDSEQGAAEYVNHCFEKHRNQQPAQETETFYCYMCKHATQELARAIPHLQCTPTQCQALNLFPQFNFVGAEIKQRTYEEIALQSKTITTYSVMFVQENESETRRLQIHVANGMVQVRDILRFRHNIDTTDCHDINQRGPAWLDFPNVKRLATALEMTDELDLL